MEYICCRACGRTIKGIDRHRMIAYAHRIFCDMECLDWFKAQQERIFGERKSTEETPIPIMDE